MATAGVESGARRGLHAAAILGVAAVVAVGLVSVVYDLAQPRIEASQRAQRLAQLSAVLGGVRYDNDPLADVTFVRDPEWLGVDEALPVHRARLAGEPAALLVTAVAPDGYAGAIRLLVAIDANGRLLGVRVLSHRETPGLGDAIEERRSPLDPDLRRPIPVRSSRRTLAGPQGRRRLRPVHRCDRDAASDRRGRAQRARLPRAPSRTAVLRTGGRCGRALDRMRS